MGTYLTLEQDSEVNTAPFIPSSLVALVIIIILKFSLLAV